MKNKESISYPIVIQPELGMFTVKIVDLGIVVAVPLPSSGISSKFLLELSVGVGKAILRADEFLTKRKGIHKPAPLPSSTKKLFDPSTKPKSHWAKKGLTSKEFAEAIGGIFSERTIRRMGDRGEIKCFKTRGGHRRFFEDEIDRLRNGG